MLRHMRLQVAGMGAFTTLQFTLASAAEQSKEPSPGFGTTHDGFGGVWTQSFPASEYVEPSGQTPASVKGNARHP